jgi:hypothetical protein
MLSSTLSMSGMSNNPRTALMCVLFVNPCRMNSFLAIPVTRWFALTRGESTRLNLSLAFLINLCSSVARNAPRRRAADGSFTQTPATIRRRARFWRPLPRRRDARPTARIQAFARRPTIDAATIRLLPRSHRSGLRPRISLAHKFDGIPFHLTPPPPPASSPSPPVAPARTPGISPYNSA